MAGLLPSEGKLRGSPANILGGCTRDKICRAFLFSEHREHDDFRARNFSLINTDRTHDATYRARDANNARYMKSPQFMRVCAIKINVSAHHHSAHHCAGAHRTHDKKILHHVTH